MSMLNKTTWFTAILLILARSSEAETWDDTLYMTDPGCPPQYTWSTWSEGFLTGSTGQDNADDRWTPVRGAKGAVQDAKGMIITLQPGAGNNDTALASSKYWTAPVYAAVRFQSTGAPGIPSTFNLRQDGVKESGEIDFVVATVNISESRQKHFVSTPIWTLDDTGVLRKLKTLGSDAEVKVVLGDGTTYATNISSYNDNFAGDKAEQASYFDQNWGITWQGFNPTNDENRYGIAWHSDKIEIYAGNIHTAMPLRMTVSKITTEDTFPKGPLPITFGPWESTGDWAGVADWAEHSNPTMTTFHIDVYGCLRDA